MLTNTEIDTCFDGLMPSGSGKSRYDIARAIIAAYQAKLRQGVELPEPVGRTMRFIGKDEYARKHSYCARTYDELPKGTYSDTWQDLEQLFTKDQLLQVDSAAEQRGYMRGLEDAKRVASVTANLCSHPSEIADAIDKLMGGE